MVEWFEKNCLILLLDNSTIVTRDGLGRRMILQLPTGDGEGTRPARDKKGRGVKVVSTEPSLGKGLRIRLVRRKGASESIGGGGGSGC